MSRPDLNSILAPACGAYSKRTIKGYCADLRIFIDWCTTEKTSWLPASPAVVASFVDHQVAYYCISTIKRRLCAIAFAHRMLDMPLPTDSNMVRLAIRRAARQRVARPEQKLGLTHTIRAQLLAACPNTLAGLRDAAIISVGYDTLCRSSELSAMCVEHLELQRDRTSSVLVPRTKADVAGDGRIAYLSSDTVRMLCNWIAEAGLRNGALFRSLHLHRVGNGPISTSSIRRLIKRATERAGLDPALIASLSGHSMRIGAAQDMMVAGFDALAIMQAGGWKSSNVVLRYVEKASTRELHDRRWKQLHRLSALNT